MFLSYRRINQLVLLSIGTPRKSQTTPPNAYKIKKTRLKQINFFSLNRSNSEPQTLRVPSRTVLLRQLGCYSHSKRFLCQHTTSVTACISSCVDNIVANTRVRKFLNQKPWVNSQVKDLCTCSLAFKSGSTKLRGTDRGKPSQ